VLDTVSRLDVFHLAVAAYPELHPGFKGMPHPGTLYAFLPGKGQLYWNPVQLAGQPGRHGLQHHILLVAESAADIGLDHPHLAERDIKGLAHYAPGDMGNLGGGYQDDVVHGVHIGQGGVVLQMAVVHYLGGVFTIEKMGAGRPWPLLLLRPRRTRAHPPGCRWGAAWRPSASTSWLFTMGGYSSYSTWISSRARTAVTSSRATTMAISSPW
jgi:hypothetical protein